MKFLLTGIGIVVAGVVISIVTNDWTYLYKVTGIVGFICLGIGALFSGAFVPGDRLARNLSAESETDRRNRFTFTNRIFLIGLPNITCAIIVFLLLN